MRCVGAALIACAMLSVSVSATTYNVAPLARASASSEHDEYPAESVLDGRARILDRYEWRSRSTTTSWGQIDYPSLRLDWPTAQRVDKVVLYDSPSLDRHVAGVTLHFSDSSRIFVNSIDNSGIPRVVDFPEKEIEWMEVEVTDADGVDVGLSEIEVYSSLASTPDYVGKVNPYIETARGRYFFFATGSLPFGMISSAPLTRNKNQYGGGYNYNSKDILGFPQLHDWMMGALVAMPVTGDIDLCGGEQAWKSPFLHEGEIVRPGYHRVYLEKYKTLVEQTVTDRVSVYRCTYSEPTSDASMLLSLQGYVGTTTMVRPRVSKIDERTITGELTTVGRLWGGPDSVKVYYAVCFDRPIVSMNGWSEKGVDKDIVYFSSEASAVKHYPDQYFSYWDAPSAGVRMAFGDMMPGDTLGMKIAVSYVSRENALENIAGECPDWDFDSVHRAATSVWNQWLGRIDVSGGTSSQQEKFYTDLWHVLLGRHKINDLNGDYPDYTQGRRDGAVTRDIKFKSRKLPMNADGTPKFNMYNSDSFWLSQWNLNVLWGLAWPEVLDDFSACLVQYAENGGLIPRGPNIGGYSYIMTACPGTSLICSAFQKGMMTKINPMVAYKHMKRNHTGGGMMGSPEEIEHYETKGYFADNAGITLEAAFQDWALAEMASRLGQRKDADYFRKRASSWPVLFNDSLKLIMPKLSDGRWLHNNPLDGWGWVEANAWQATWSVSHQLDRLAELMGGCDSMAHKLDYAFRMAEKDDFLSSYSSGYVSYANQPGLSNAHVFNRIGHGELAQKWVRKVQAKSYGYNNPDRGYGGHDEDQGQMGAMSALMAIGLFSVTGTASSEPVYDITSPIFDKVTIKLQAPYYTGSEFVIEMTNNSEENYLIGSAEFNGTAINPHMALLKHSSLAKGGCLKINLVKP